MEDIIKTYDKILSKSNIIMNYTIDKDFFEHILDIIMSNNCNIRYQILDIPIRTLSEDRPSYMKGLNITLCNDRLDMALTNPEACGEEYYSDSDYIGCEKLNFSMLDMIALVRLENHFQKELENRDRNKWLYYLEDKTKSYLMFIRHDVGTRHYIITLAKKIGSDNNDS